MCAAAGAARPAHAPPNGRPPPPSRCPPLQSTLFHTLGYDYGVSTELVWKMVGAGLMTLLPGIAYTLKARRRRRAVVPAAAGWEGMQLQQLGGWAARPGSPVPAPQGNTECRPPPRRAQDKAESDLLALPVSRTLNLGLMAASVGHLLVLAPIMNKARTACTAGAAGRSSLKRLGCRACLPVPAHPHARSAATPHSCHPCRSSPRSSAGPRRLDAAAGDEHLGQRPAGLHGRPGGARSRRPGGSGRQRVNDERRTPPGSSAWLS